MVNEGFLVHALRYTYVLVVYNRRVASDCAYTVLCNESDRGLGKLNGLRYGGSVLGTLSIVEVGSCNGIPMHAAGRYSGPIRTAHLLVYRGDHGAGHRFPKTTSQGDLCQQGENRTSESRFSYP